jgi:hypothetical protein
MASTCGADRMFPGTGRILRPVQRAASSASSSTERRDRMGVTFRSPRSISSRSAVQNATHVVQQIIRRLLSHAGEQTCRHGRRDLGGHRIAELRKHVFVEKAARHSTAGCLRRPHLISVSYRSSASSLNLPRAFLAALALSCASISFCFSSSGSRPASTNVRLPRAALRCERRRGGPKTAPEATRCSAPARAFAR